MNNIFFWASHFSNLSTQKYHNFTLQVFYLHSSYAQLSNLSHSHESPISAKSDYSSAFAFTFASSAKSIFYLRLLSSAFTFSTLDIVKKQKGKEEEEEKWKKRRRRRKTIPNQTQTNPSWLVWVGWFHPSKIMNPTQPDHIWLVRVENSIRLVLTLKRSSFKIEHASKEIIGLQQYNQHIY